MKNIQDLRDYLMANYEKAKNGKMSIGLAKELSNSAGKIISTAKMQLEYNKYMGIKENIPFMKIDDKK